LDIEKIAEKIVHAAIKVHTVLGPGLLESAYQKCMEYELKKQGMATECEKALPIVYETVMIDAGYRMDMWLKGVPSRLRGERLSLICVSIIV
jgi:GxxExxY protein